MSDDSLVSETVTNDTLRVTPGQLSSIVSQYAHDVRNQTNVLNLEITILAEQEQEPDALAGLERMRGQISQLESALRGLVAKLGELRPVILRAAELLDLWKGQMSSLEDANHKIDWHGTKQVGACSIDPSAILWLLRELVLQSWKRSAAFVVKALVEVVEGRVTAQVEQAPGTTAHPKVEDLQHIIGRNHGVVNVSLKDTTDVRVISLCFPAVPIK